MSVTFERAGMTYSVSEIDPDYGPIHDADGPSLNVSNDKAVFLMGLLGMEFVPYGEMAGEDFLGRVLMAMGLYGHDEGVPSRELLPGEDAGIFGIVRDGGPRFLDGGRREGYADERLAILRTVAEDAIAHGVDVQWA